MVEQINPKMRIEENILSIMQTLSRKIREGSEDDTDQSFSTKKRIKIMKMLLLSLKTPELSEEYEYLKNWFLEEEQRLERSYVAQID